MPLRNRREPLDPDLRDHAKQIAGRSGEALKEFAESTGSAAKEFAGRTRDAAKELVEAIERAAQGVEPHDSRRGRKLLIAAAVAGIGVALVASDRVRERIGGRRPEPQPFQPRSEGGNGAASAPVSPTTEQPT